MTILSLLIAIILMQFLFVIILVIIYIWLNRRNIDSFIHPEKYCEVTMYELDENKRVWLQDKNSELKFGFNGMDYNMYHPEVEEVEVEGIIEKKFKKNSAIYRSGRLASFTYMEGIVSPLDMRDLKKSYNTDSVIKKEFNKVDLAKMVNSVDDGPKIDDMLKFVMLFLLLIILLVLIFKKANIDYARLGFEVAKALSATGTG